jgi:hypothetical protein
VGMWELLRRLRLWCRDMATFKRYANFDTEMGKFGKAHLKTLAIRVGFAARMFVGHDTGALQKTIRPDARATKSTKPNHYEIYVRAGSMRVNYALKHHQGFSPYKIISDDSVMVFPSGGRVVYTHEVNHPGFSGNPYFIKAADATLGQGVATHFRGQLGP